MGTPLPPDPPPDGDQCENCWGPDKPLGDSTPGEISITLYDLQEGEFWADIYREELFTPTTLFQDAILPCFFANVTTNFQWFIDFGPGGTIVLIDLRFFPNRDAFRRVTVDECIRSGANDIIAPDGVIAFGGSMSVYLGSD